MSDELFERLMRDRVFRFRAVWAVLAVLVIFVLLPLNWLAACLAGIGIALLARGIEQRMPGEQREPFQQASQRVGFVDKLLQKGDDKK